MGLEHAADSADNVMALVNPDGAPEMRNETSTKEEGGSTAMIVKEPEFVIFVDPIGTRWQFPLEKSRTWADVANLIRMAFSDILVPDIVYTLTKELEEIDLRLTIIEDGKEQSSILPQHWETWVRPGFEFTIVAMKELTWVFKRSIKEQRESRENGGSSSYDIEEADETSTAKPTLDVLYVAKRMKLVDGRLRFEDNKEQQDRIQVLADDILQAGNLRSVLEEHREVIDRESFVNSKSTVKDLVGNPVLYIKSPILLNALKAIISLQSPTEIYKPQDTYGDSLTTDIDRGRYVHPLTDLHHYREKISLYKETVKASHDEEYAKTCREHIDILLRYLDDHLQSSGLGDVSGIPSQDSSIVSFNSLWLLLKPGADILVREHGLLNAYVIERVSGGPNRTPDGPILAPYSVDAWNLNFNGRVFGRALKKFTIPIFDGRREVTSLRLFPAELYEKDRDKSWPSYRQKLIERGKRYIETVRTPTFQEYDGPSRLQGIKKYKNARVIIDHLSEPWLKELDPNDELVELPIPTEAPEPDLGFMIRTPRCSCEACESRASEQDESVQIRLFDDYDNINLDIQDNFTDHQYMLCNSHVYGFVLKDRVWDLMDVFCLTTPTRRPRLIDGLVMKPEGNKEMIKAVCEMYGGLHKKTFRADLIEGKGEGQILLLHGPPGTGKTLTAECVAEYTGRPLLSISAADLGHEPIELEKNLLRFFRNATKWNAVVLLDEADVYLESRDIQDLRRNSIVSVFLRALDYFEGILFLTTNRVGTFDEAFLSRIHVQIGYDSLDEESRKKIWDSHFDRLSAHRDEKGRRIQVDYAVKDYVKKSREVKDLKWNGREIRNAFQTAVALACYEDKKRAVSDEEDTVPILTDDHFRQVVEMSKNFKRYLRSFRGHEEERALMRSMRNDEKKDMEEGDD